MDYENELRGFLDKDLKLKQYPSKAAKRTIALQYVSDRFEQGRKYNEKEVNEVIKSIISFADFTLLRRELVDAKILSRSKDGRTYIISSSENTGTS